MRYPIRSFAGLSCALIPALSASAASTHFDNSLEGWRVVSYPYTHNPDPAMNDQCVLDSVNGLTAPSLRVKDVFGETGIAAPSSFLGDQSSAYGASLEYDIFLRYTDGAVYPAAILNAGTFSLYFPRSSPAAGQWTHVIMPLTPGPWHVNSSQGVLATEAQIRDALSHLHGLYIYTEWHTGPDDTNVDNVVLGADDACPSDFDHSGFVDTDDFTAFVLAFEAGTDDADFDHSGFVDTDDFTAFVLAFESGC